MRLSKWFYVVVIALVVVMILFEMTIPDRFNWNPDYHHSSKQPFGLYALDSVLSASVSQGYSLSGQSLPQIYRGINAKVPSTYLIIDEYDRFSEEDVDAIKSMLERGDNFILVFSNASDYYERKDEIGYVLGFGCINEGHHYYDLKKYLGESERIDIIHCPAYGSWKKANYSLLRGLTQSSLSVKPSYRVLAKVSTEIKGEKKHYPIAAVRQYGKGRVVVASSPLLFTNYGILNDNIRPYVLRMLSAAGNAPVVRIDDSLDDAGEKEESQSLFRYLLDNPPLRWALYLTVVALLLFMIFTARRKQRVIPVMAPPENMAMAMVRHIGTMYYQRHDNVDLVRKKYAYFSEQLRRRVMIDLDDEEHFDTELQSLSQITGVPENELKQRIYEVWRATNESRLSDKYLRQLIGLMNDILKKT